MREASSDHYSSIPRSLHLFFDEAPVELDHTSTSSIVSTSTTCCRKRLKQGKELTLIKMSKPTGSRSTYQSLLRSLNSLSISSQTAQRASTCRKFASIPESRTGAQSIGKARQRAKTNEHFGSMVGKGGCGATGGSKRGYKTVQEQRSRYRSGVSSLYLLSSDPRTSLPSMSLSAKALMLMLLSSPFPP